ASVSFTAAPTDNCGVASTTYLEGVTALSSPHTFNAGSHTVSVIVADIHGNSATNSFTVTVNDNEAPVVNAPANITVNNDAAACSASVTFAASPTDNCGVASTTYLEGVTALSSPHTFNVGSHTLSVIVADIHGNSATNSFTV